MVSVLQATAVLSQNLREKVDAISIWQDTTQQTIKELSTNLTKLPEEVSMLLSGTITAIALLSYSKVHALKDLQKGFFKLQIVEQHI